MKKNKREKLSSLQTLAREIAPIAKRVKSRCPYFGECGGCLLQDMQYEDQLVLKREFLNRIFERAGMTVRISSVESSPSQWFYRNRMDYPVGPNGEIGLKKFGSWRNVIDLKKCFLLSPETPEILQAARDWMNRWNLPGWNNANYSGFVRYVVLREGKHTSERLILIVTNDSLYPEEIWNDAVKRFSRFCTSLYHGINARATDISIPSELRLLRGTAYVSEKINGHTYKIFPSSFFQTNSDGAELLQKRVGTEILGSRLLDLYCGLGFFAIDAAARGISVLGVEIDSSATELAKENARINNVSAEFIASPVEFWLKSGGDERVAKFNPETIIVDPSRAGLHPAVLDWLTSQRAPRLVYVSCNAERFVREWQTLSAAYDCVSMQAIDMFPHTPHVELIATLRPRAS